MNEYSLTNAQIRKIQTLFSKLGFSSDDKKNIIRHLTLNRASSTKDLRKDEAKYLINYLEGNNINQISLYELEDINNIDELYKNNEVKQAYYDKCLKEVKSIYKLSYDIGMCYGDTYEDKMMNIAVINKFCRERGTVKKNIKEMDLKELRKTKKQFEAMLQNNTKSAVNKATNKILNETVK